MLAKPPFDKPLSFKLFDKKIQTGQNDTINQVWDNAVMVAAQPFITSLCGKVRMQDSLPHFLAILLHIAGTQTEKFLYFGADPHFTL